MDALSEIRARVQAAGLERKDALRANLELAFHCMLLVGGAIGFLVLESPWLRFGALAPMMLGHLGLATNTHTALHGAISDRRWINRLLSFFGSPFVSSISATFWWDKHNRRHHGAPNVRGIDPDHDFAPYFALAESDLAGKGRLWRLYHRFQWIPFPFALALMVPRMQAEGWIFALRQLFRGPERALALVDVLALCGSLLLWCGLPLFFVPLRDVVLLNVVREVALSYGFFAMFAPAHMPHEALFLERPVEGDFLLQQTATTLNFRAPQPLAFFLSGLEHQIEHHLFPGVAHGRYTEIAPIVEDVCRRHGYPYRVVGWGSALAAMGKVLRHPKPVTVLTP